MEKPITTIAALLLAALAAGPAPAEELTWQEANKRSAALIREKGPSAEAARFARKAFELYPEQTKSYNAQVHAQLLLNLADTQNKLGDRTAALKDIDRGADAIADRAGVSSPMLVTVWQEAVRIAGPESDLYYTARMLEAVEGSLDPDAPPTLRLVVKAVDDLRVDKGGAWAAEKLRAARERAAKSGEDSLLVAQIDLVSARLEMERGHSGEAVDRYNALIGRLEQRSGRDHALLLEAAYAQLEHLYEKKRDTAAAADMRRRRLDYTGSAGSELVPLARVAPRYPGSAARSGTEGFVEFYLVVAADGSVAGAEVLRSSPPGVFDRTALEAVRQWKFRPRAVDGKPVESAGIQRIDFKMGR